MKNPTHLPIVLLVSAIFFQLLKLSSYGQESRAIIHVSISPTLDSLIVDEDTDGDTKITIDDYHVIGTESGNKRFWIIAADRTRYEVAGTYFLSNLLQELSLAKSAARESTAIRMDRVFEPPVDRISRSIRERYWDGLTRRIDEAGLPQILEDEKTQTVDGFRYLYVPPSDTFAFSYFTAIGQRHPQWRMNVVRLPQKITAEFVRSLDGRHGLLTLALERDATGTVQGKPFVVPGGRFNEMYGWDSYFIVLGLLQDGRIDLARSMVEQFHYEITHYGAILNANRTYYLTRSQPPFFTSMALAVFDRMSKDEKGKEWLRTMLQAAIQEYRGVWMNRDRLTRTGLSRYYDFGRGVPPEVEPGHFDPVFTRVAQRYGSNARQFEEAYRSGKIKSSELDEYFVHDRSMRESGHDTSYRLIDRSANLVTVDLNSLLYKIEMDLARTIEDTFGGSLPMPDGTTERSAEWNKRAEKRKALIDRYLWDDRSGMYFDYDIVRNRRIDYVSATTFYPMWAGCATVEQAASLITHALPLLEAAGGIVSTGEESRGPITQERPQRQWDYPFGWAPHQMLVWRAMQNHGHDSIAWRLAYRWLFTITRNAVDYHGTVPEKFDLVDRTHQVFAEYGNVGTKFAYITREGFGWTNASYQLGLELLTRDLRESLNRLIPPEWLLE